MTSQEQKARTRKLLKLAKEAVGIVDEPNQTRKKKNYKEKKAAIQPGPARPLS